MADHDPLCYQSHRAGGPTLGGPCECVVIRQARADERERIAQAIENECDRGDYTDWEKRVYDDAAGIARNGGQ